jgi:hypothetical protein
MAGPTQDASASRAVGGAPAEARDLSGATVTELPALDGRDPLGFLAALGLLRLLTGSGTTPRLAWSAETGCAMLHAPLAGTGAIASALADAVTRIGDDCVIGGAGPDFPLVKQGTGSDPMRVRREDFRGLADRTSPGAHPWLAVLVTDLAVDRAGRAALTLYVAPSGQQSLRTFFGKPLAVVRAEPARLAEALTGGRRADGFTGEYLDHRVLRSAADHPSGRSLEAGVPGATWLAAQALPLLRLTGDGHRAAATLWHRLGRRQVMIWPLWRPALDIHAVGALLAHPLLRPERGDADGAHAAPVVPRAALAPLGVIDVYGAERQAIEGRKNAGALAPVTVADAP